MLALARDRAGGAHPYLVTPEHSAQARAVLGEGRLLAPEQAVVVEPAADVARERARAHLDTYLALPNYTNNFRRLGFTDDDLADQGSDRLVDALVAWGDAEAVLARPGASRRRRRSSGAAGPRSRDDGVADGRPPRWRRRSSGAEEAVRACVAGERSRGVRGRGNAVEACVAGERSRGLRGRGTQIVELEGIEPSSAERVTGRATTIPDVEALGYHLAGSVAPHLRSVTRTVRTARRSFPQVSGLSRRQRSFPAVSTASVAGLRWTGPASPRGSQ